MKATSHMVLPINLGMSNAGASKFYRLLSDARTYFPCILSSTFLPVTIRGFTKKILYNRNLRRPFSTLIPTSTLSGIYPNTAFNDIPDELNLYRDHIRDCRYKSIALKISFSHLFLMKSHVLEVP